MAVKEQNLAAVKKNDKFSKKVEMWMIGAAVGAVVLLLLTICIVVKCCCRGNDSSLNKVEIGGSP